MNGGRLGSFPEELLSLIFLYSLPNPPSFSSSSTPLSVSHVCRRWRAVAYGTHELWSIISLTRSTPKCTWDNLLPLMSVWLKGAGEHPLDITINILDDDTEIFYSGDFYEFRKRYREFAALLLPRLHLIRSFNGTLPGSMVPDLQLECMPEIEELELAGAVELAVNARAGLEPIKILNKVPKLRALSIDGLSFNLQTIPMQQQLTRLELTNLEAPARLSPRRALQIFQTLSSLKVCALDLDHQDADPMITSIPPGGRLGLPKLSHLFLSWNDVVDIGPLLDCISTPNLLRFGIRGTPQPIVGSWNYLRNFLIASWPPNLTRLTIGDTVDIDIRLADCLRAVPSLRELRINHGLIDRTFLATLVWDEDNPEQQILPNLVSLRLGVCPDFGEMDLLPVLASRVAPELRGATVQELDELVIRACSGLRPEYERFIRDSGVKNVILNDMDIVRMPFNMGILPFVRIAETHKDLFSD